MWSVSQILISPTNSLPLTLLILIPDLISDNIEKKNILKTVISML